MHRRGALLLVLAVVATLAIQTSAHAAVVVVDCDATNSDIFAIQSAVNAAANFDTIRLKGTCNFSAAEPAGGDHASIQNAGVVIRPGAPVIGLTIESDGTPQSASVIGQGNENAFFIAPGNNQTTIRGLQFVRLGRPIVAVNATGVTIGDGANGTTPDSRGNRILGEFGASSAILAVGRDRGFGDPAGTLTVKHGGGASSTATFAIPAGQKLQDFTAVGNFVTYADPGLPPGDPADIVAIDVRQSDGGKVEGVDILRNATGFLVTQIPSFSWNAVRVQAHRNDGAYHINDVEVTGNNFGMLEELTPSVQDPNRAGRAGVLLARVDGFTIGSNRVRAAMTPTPAPTPGGGIVMTDSSNGTVSGNAVIVLADLTTLSSDLGAYGVVDDLFALFLGGAGGGTPSQHIVLENNIVGPMTTSPPGIGAQRGFLVNGSTNITVRGNNVKFSSSFALNVAMRVQGPFAQFTAAQKAVHGSGFCGNLLDGKFDDPKEVGFEEDGLSGSTNNSLPDGTSVFGNGHCVAPAANVAISGGDTQVCEGGLTDTYSIVLTLRPSAPVVVTMNGGSQLTTVPPSVTFTYANWKTPQIVTVVAIDDAVYEGTHGGSISHTVSSTDPAYNGLPVVGVAAIICDNDPAPPPPPPPPPPPVKSVIITETFGSTNVVEGGAGDTYTIHLSHAPTGPGPVQVNIFHNNSQLNVAPTSVLFTGATWNIPQVINVSAVNDVVHEGPHTSQIVHASFGGGDPGYEGIGIPGVLVHITDDDPPPPPDVTPPAPPTVFAGTCPPAITVKTLTLSGTAEAGSLVKIYANAALMTATFANASGFWTATLTFTANGTYTITATATDAANNVSAVATLCTVVVNADFTPPAAPVIQVPLPNAFVGTPTIISGTSDPDSVTVEVREPCIPAGILLGSASGTSGTWSIAPTLAEGTHTVCARAFDAASNVSPWSAPRSFTVDRTPPTITITRPAFYLGFQVFMLGGGTLRGRATDKIGVFNPGFVQRVEVTYRNLLTGVVTTSTATCTQGCGTDSISWEDQPSLGLVGLFAVQARAFDRANNSSSAATETVIVLLN